MVTLRNGDLKVHEKVAMWLLDCQEWLWLEEKSQWSIMINEAYKGSNGHGRGTQVFDRRSDTQWLKEHERTYKTTWKKFNVTSRVYPCQRDQHKWVTTIELSRIRSRWDWLSTPMIKIKMHWWVDDYGTVQSWCTWYGAMWHVAMKCSQPYGINSLTPWVMPSNFSELSKDARY
jgi:hypothetical protein